jgi:hypothetical protein
VYSPTGKAALIGPHAPVPDGSVKLTGPLSAPETPPHAPLCELATVFVPLNVTVDGSATRNRSRVELMWLALYPFTPCTAQLTVKPFAVD